MDDVSSTSDAELVDHISSFLHRPLYKECREVEGDHVFIPVGVSSSRGSLFQLVVYDYGDGEYTIELVDICGLTISNKVVKFLDFEFRKKVALKLADKWFSELDQFKYYKYSMYTKIERLERWAQYGESRPSEIEKLKKWIQSGESILQELDRRAKNE